MGLFNEIHEFRCIPGHGKEATLTPTTLSAHQKKTWQSKTHDDTNVFFLL